MKKYKKKKIPKSLRDKCWNNYVGETNAQCQCICCGYNIIKMLQFECGHIVAERNGGSLDLNNLLPICGTYAIDLWEHKIWKNILPIIM